MVAKFNKLIKQMTEAGDRVDPGSLNNMQDSLFDFSFGLVGKDRMGCGEQAGFVGEQMEGLKFQDKWSFKIMSGFPNGLPHQWIEAHSSNPTDPVLIIDPWNSYIGPK